MSLYLCIFDGDEDIDGVEVGTYSEYGAFLDQVINTCEGGRAGSKYPLLTSHSDCDGEWTVDQCRQLEIGLVEIANCFRDRPPRSFPSPAQDQVAKSIGFKPSNLLESFLDVDGEPLLDRLIDLTRTAQRTGCPILFQ